MYMYHIFLIHPYTGGHGGCFHTLAVVNSAAVNTDCTCVFKLWFSPNVCLGMELLIYMILYF